MCVDQDFYCHKQYTTKLTTCQALFLEHERPSGKVILDVIVLEMGKPLHVHQNGGITHAVQGPSDAFLATILGLMGPATVKMVDGGFSDRQGGEAEGADTLLKLIDKPALLFPCDAVPGKVLTGIVQRGHTVGSLLHKVKSY
jgi:hypothetical protein